MCAHDAIAQESAHRPCPDSSAAVSVLVRIRFPTPTPSTAQLVWGGFDRQVARTMGSKAGSSALARRTSIVPLAKCAKRAHCSALG